MSRKDRDRLKVLHEVRKRHITQVQAGKELAISPRWVRELLRRMKARGDRAVVHGLRGRRSNRRLPEAMKARAVKLFREQKQARQWHDYGPTLAAEELAEHGLQVGKRRCESGCCRPDCGRRGEPGWSERTCGAADEHAGESCCSGTPVRTIGWKDEESRCI